MVRWKIVVLNVHTSMAAAIVTVASARSAVAQSPAPLWNLTFGYPHARANAAAMDHAGGVYVAGLAPSDLYGPRQGAYVVRFSASGSTLWGRQFAEAHETTEAYAVCTDATGGVFVAGEVIDSPPYYWHVFVTRFNLGGDELWDRRLASDGVDVASAAAGDGQGGVFVAGYTSGSLGAPNAGFRDAFVARYNASGDLLWVRQLGTPELDHCLAAVPDGSGGVYIAGSTIGFLAPNAPGNNDCWLARYDGTGERLWVVQFGTPGGDGIKGMCPDGGGGLYACGFTYGSLGGPQAGYFDAFVVRLTGAGQIVWARQLGGPGADEAWSVSADGVGGVYVLGDTEGSLAPPNLGEDDIFLARYSGAGQRLWAQQFGSEFYDRPRSSAPDASGGVYITGHRSMQGGGTLATLARFPGPCYANCDGSTGAPALNVGDFACFLQQFAAAEAYANCDGSTAAPALNVADFTCFLRMFAAGCP